MNKHRICFPAAILYELSAAAYEIIITSENEPEDEESYYAIGELLSSFVECIEELSGVPEQMAHRISVKIENGKHSGKTGTIAGTLRDRSALVEAGLRKIVVRIGDQFFIIPIDYVRELSQQERILLGLE